VTYCTTTAQIALLWSSDIRTHTNTDHLLIACMHARTTATATATIVHTVICTGMQDAYNLLWGDRNLAAQIRSNTYGCSKMTDADLISIVGYVAVVMSGGGGCNWYPGRPDSTGYDDTSKCTSN
jgi:hypothetical protein